MPQPTIAQLLDDSLIRFRPHIFCIERKRFRRRTWTYQELDYQARLLAQLLANRHIKAGDCVGLCAPNGPWWVVVYITCARAGITIVPIDVNSSPEFVDKVARKTNLKLLFKTVYKPLPKARWAVIELEQLAPLLQGLSPAHRVRRPKPDDTLEIVFTSGSTGDPKGVVLTQNNVASNVLALKKAWGIGHGYQLLSMIPLSHMFEQTVGFLAPFISGSSVVYVDSVRPYQIVKALQSERINTIVTVPAFLSLLYRRIMEKAELSHYRKFLEGELRFVKYLPRPVRRYVFQGLYWQLGQSLKLVGVGGAGLPESLETFWETLGIRVMQGYGLTETSPIATYNGPEGHKPRSVGRVLPGQALELGEDGEILLGGPNVFGGYFLDEASTKPVLKNGTFYTGDIGRIDEQGFLFITGRKKNMLLSESGLNIYPEDIETQLAGFSEIKDSVVLFTKVGGNDVLTAVVLTDVNEARLAAVIKQANTHLASHQRIQRSIVWPEPDFPRTPTRKVKRQPIIDRLSSAVQKKADNEQSGSANLSQLQLLVADVAGKPASTVQATTNLVDDLGLDSLQRLELVSKIEEQLGAFIDESSITPKTTFAELETMTQAAERSPKPQLFNFSFFESWGFSNIRLFLQMPLLAWTAYYQRLQGDRLKPTSNPVIYIANHTSHFDSLTVLRLLPFWRRRVLIAAAKDYFFKNRLQAALLRLFLPIIPLDREGGIQQSLEQLGGYLDKGYSIVIFPEGTRSTTGRQQSFKQGIGVMAQELEVPIVPIKLVGNDSIMPKGRRWPIHGTTRVLIGKPLLFGKDQAYSRTTTALEKAVAEL